MRGSRARRERKEKARVLVVAFFAVDFSVAVKKLDCSNNYFSRMTRSCCHWRKRECSPPCFGSRRKTALRLVFSQREEKVHIIYIAAVRGNSPRRMTEEIALGDNASLSRIQASSSWQARRREEEGRRCRVDRISSIDG